VSLLLLLREPVYLTRNSGSFGAISTGYFAGRFGRKPSMIAGAIIFIVGSLIQTLSGYHMSHDTGLSVLCTSIVIPMRLSLTPT
jgi:MFS family permease